MLKLRIILLGLFAFVLLPLNGGGNAQQRIMHINRENLLKINKLLLEKLTAKDLKKLEGKQISVRAKVLLTDKSVNYRIEEISGDAAKELKARKNDEIVVKGYIKKDGKTEKNKFKIDLSHVLGPKAGINNQAKQQE